MLRNDKKSLSRSLKALFYRLSWSNFTFSPTIFHRRPPFYFFVWVENRHFRRTKALFRSRIYAFYELLEQFRTALMTFGPFSPTPSWKTLCNPPPICRPLLYRIAIDNFFSSPSSPRKRFRFHAYFFFLFGHVPSERN